MITDKVLQGLAENILISQTEDVEYLTICEMTEDYFTYQDTDEMQGAWEALTREEQDVILKRIDYLVGSAIVTITFPKD